MKEFITETNYGLIIISIICFVAGIVFSVCMLFVMTSSNIDENACNCYDVNQCDKCCIGKENYTKATSFSITEECKHPERLTRVIDSVGGCETTIEVCADCGEPLTEPKTNC